MSSYVAEEETWGKKYHMIIGPYKSSAGYWVEFICKELYY